MNNLLSIFHIIPDIFIHEKDKKSNKKIVSFFLAWNYFISQKRVNILKWNILSKDASIYFCFFNFFKLKNWVDELIRVLGGVFVDFLLKFEQTNQFSLLLVVFQGGWGGNLISSFIFSRGLNWWLMSILMTS